MMNRASETRAAWAACIAGATLALLACSEDHVPTDPGVAATRSAITVTLWTEGMEATPPSPLPASDLSSKFTVIGPTTGLDYVQRVGGTAGNVTHTGSFAALFRGSSNTPATNPVPTYTNDLRRLVNTSGYSNVRLTYWRRLVSFEEDAAAMLPRDRWVIRYATVASPTDSDWIEVQSTTTSSAVWEMATVEGLPASSTLWLSFRAMFQPRRNTVIVPNRWQFDEWAYIDDITLTGDTGCGSDAECSDGLECTSDTCDLMTGVCSNPFQTSGTSCSDRDGSLPGFCDGAGTCVECTMASQCADDGDACTAGPVCTSNTCGNGSPVICDDNAFCNGSETCSSLTGCVTGTPPSLDDGISCTADSCVEGDDSIAHTPSDAACDDGNPCTDDVCSATTDCSSTSVVDRVCPTGVCDASGACVECNVDNQCDNDEICSSGTCACPPGGCSTAQCGNGILEQPAEGCDDGNMIDGDGCSSNCESEAAWFEHEDVADNGPGVNTHGLAVDGLGRMLLAWQTNEGGSSRVLARRISATGAVVVADIADPLEIESGFDASWSAEPQVVGLASGGWVVVSNKDAGGGQHLISMRTVSDQGALGFPVFVSNGSPDGVVGANESSPRVARTSEGFVVSWIDTRSLGLSVTIRARRFDDTASTIGSSFVVADESLGGTIYNTLAASGSEWIVAWSRSSDNAISARRYDGGSALESAWQISSDGRAPSAAALASTGTAEFVLAWASAADTSVSAVEISAGSTPVPGDVRSIASDDGSDKEYPSAAALGTHAFVVSYDVDGVDTDFAAVARTGDTYSGDPSEAALRALLTTAGTQRGTQLTSADNGVWFTWNDDTGADPMAFPNGLRMYLLGCQGCTLSGGDGCYNVFQKIVPQGGVSQLDRYGISGAKFGETLSVSGTRMVVGSRDDAQAGVEEGAAYVYELSGSQWVQSTKLMAVDPGPGPEGQHGSFGAQYGTFTAIDGDTIAIGAPSDDGAAPWNPNFALLGEAGAVYIYEYSGGTWNETRLVSPEARVGQYLGFVLALDGDWMMAAAADGRNENPYQVLVYIFHRVGGVWTYTQKIQSAVPTEHLGWSIAIDGSTAFIAGSTSPTGGFVDAQFTVHVYDLQGETWVESQTLVSTFDEIGNYYGITLALDGDNALIGATRQDDSAVDQGVVYALVRESGFWFDLEAITSPTPTAGESFGAMVTLDGAQAAIETQPTSGENQIFAYEFDGLWNQTATIDSTTIPGVPYDEFAFQGTGAIVGEHILMGASTDSDPAYATPPGSVYAFTCAAGLSCGDGWVVTGEECDDGNNVDGDGCESDCTPTCLASGADDTCNGTDEDCDGNVDESFSPPPVTCGQGVCFANGSASCVGGGVVSSCTPGMPTGTDASCDGDDDDCDGNVDELFVGSGTMCGLGVCANTGTQTCIGGVLDSGCTPLPQGASDDYACDGLDEDCDGAVDEDCACTVQTSTVSAHQAASRAFLCSTTPTSLLSESFEGGNLNGWTATGNYSASMALARTGVWSAQAQGTGLSTLRRTFNTSGFTGVTMGFSVRTRTPTTTGYAMSVRYSTNGTDYTLVGSAGGPFTSWTTLPNNAVPSAAALTLSFEANPIATDRFVHFDDITLSATCSTSTFFATGSNTSLGTSGGASATLFNLDSEPSVWRSGACPICGNGVTEAGETCDDANRVDEGCGMSSCTYCDSHCNSVTVP